MSIKSLIDKNKNRSKFWRGNTAIPSSNSKEMVTKKEFDRRIEEIKKCRDDIFYFAKNYFYITTIDQGKQLIKIYPKQYELIQLMANHNRIVTLAARQVGKTVSYCIFCLWYVMFHQDKKILIVANKKNTALEILGRIRFAYELIPMWLKPAIETYNKSNIQWTNNSSIEGESTSSEAARGKTANILIVDEASRIKKSVLDVFWTSVYPIISSGKSSKVILVSTANGIGGLFHDVYSMAKDPIDPTLASEDWVKLRIDWWERPGRDDAWKRLQLKSMSETEFAQEYGNSFLSSTNRTLIRMGDIEKYLRFFGSRKFFYPKRIKIECPSRNSFECFQWFEGRRNRTYVIGLDTGEGIGQNLSTLEVLDVTDIDKPIEVFSFASADISYQEFAYLIYVVAGMYYNPFIAGENNGISSNILTILTSKPYEYENFVNIDTSKQSDGTRIGIRSSSTIKRDACLFLRQYIANTANQIILFNKDLVDEMLYFSKNKESFESATNKKTDDRIMSFIWAIYTLNESYCRQLYSVAEEKTLENGSVVPKYLRMFHYDGGVDYTDLIVDRDDSPNNIMCDNKFDEQFEINVKNIQELKNIDNNKCKPVRREKWFTTDEHGNLVDDVSDDEKEIEEKNTDGIVGYF